MVTNNPKKALIYSLIFGAGVGQIYNNQIKKGVLMLVLFFVPLFYTIYLIILNFLMLYKLMPLNLMFLIELINKIKGDELILKNLSFLFIIWLISAIDSFVSARLLNKITLNNEKK